jgi:O-antigen biosynthesis protein WbqP
MKRIFDLFLGLLLLIFAFLILVTALLVKFISPGHVIHWSDQVEKNNRIFSRPKFRPMRVDTPAVATHLLQYAENYLKSNSGCSI